MSSHLANCNMVLVEGDPLIRELLAARLQELFHAARLVVFGEGGPALEHCLRNATELVIMDLRLRDMDGREFIRHLRTHECKVRIVVLTGELEPALPGQLIALGVAGLVEKRVSMDHIIRAVEQVRAGGIYFFAGVTPAISPAASRNPFAGISTTAADLSERDHEIARLVAGGCSSKEIAARLGLSTRTVENNRAHLMKKIGLRDTASLVRWCVHQGLD